MRIQKQSRWISPAILLAAIAGGCASHEKPDAAPASSAASSATSSATHASAQAGKTPAHAECLVCKKNADLACVDVDVDKKTPTAQYNGKTYYFCSDECKGEFAKNPAKYAGK
jgi:YHS domain-containing protein